MQSMIACWKKNVPIGTFVFTEGGRAEIVGFYDDRCEAMVKIGSGEPFNLSFADIDLPAEIHRLVYSDRTGY